MKEERVFTNRSRTIKDILSVSVSNIAKLLAGVLAGFLLPKIVGVTDYGYYKTFTLYATYIGLFHFGISDGIYLQYGGIDYENLEKSRFRFYTRFFFLLETILAVIIGLICVISLEGENRFIFSCIAIYLVFHNGTSYYQSISQITSRFKELSARNLIQSAFTALTVLILWVPHYFGKTIITYRIYTVCYLGISIILAVWYIYTYRDITFGTIEVRWNDILHFIKIGFPLMVANLCSSLILTLDRQFVNILFTTEVYAVYAFAYNMLSLVTTATSAVSTVLYPNLKKVSEEKLKNTYSDLISFILMFMYASMIIYFPLNLFVTWFLPKYTGALIIFRIIFPGLAISSAITVVMHNYYKALGLSNKFFIKCVIAIIVSGLANYAAYAIFGTTHSISIASIITLVFWYVLVEFYFWKEYKVKWQKNFIYMIVMMAAFYLITITKNQYLAFAMYTVAYLAITIVFFRTKINSLLKKRSSR